MLRVVTLLVLITACLVSGQQTQFTFDDIFNFRPKGFDGKWMENSDLLIFTASNGDISLFNPVQNTTSVILDAATYSGLEGDRYSVSPDLRYILIATGIKQVWRHSRTAVFKIYDRNASPDNRIIEFPNNPSIQNTRLQYVKWAKKSNGLSFVVGNNLWWQASPTASAQQLTSTGDPVYIFNGRSDWLYEEDVLGTDEAHWISPDSTTIVYGYFNNTNMDVIRFPMYGQEEDVYGRIEEITFPKAGVTAPGRNTRGELYVVNLSDTSAPHKKLQAPELFRTQDHYFTKVGWRDNNHLVVAWVNRPQNQTIFTICNVNTAVCVENWGYIVIDGWVNVPWHGFQFSGDSSRFFTILPKDEAGVGTVKHLVEFSAPTDRGGFPTFLTSGYEEHTTVVGYDDNKKHIFYIATGGDPRDRHLYRVGSTQADFLDQLEIICLTCNLGIDCEYVSASFSPSGQYYIQRCLGPDVPTYVVKNSTVIPNPIVYTFENNTAFRDVLRNKNMPTRTFTSVSIDDDYPETDAELILPPGYSASNSYNVLVFTYAGPESQKISKRYPLGSNNNGWMMYLSAQHNIIIASVDGRGTRGRGDRWMFEVYRHLGGKEIWDQVTGTRNLMNANTAMNQSRVAIWGWSYGGFTTSHAVTNESNVFDCGLAVAPATHWDYVDSALAERYLGLATASDNQEGYQRTSVMSKAASFRGKTFMVVHGTADDNVHIHNTAQLVQALTRERIPFYQAYYTDKNHSIRGPDTDRHLYATLSNFLLKKCWGRPGI